MFHNTGVGKSTILSALSDVTLTNVAPAGIAAPLVAVAVTATAELCTQTEAVTVHATTDVPVTVVPVTADADIGATTLQAAFTTSTSLEYSFALPVRRTSLLKTLLTLLIF